VSQFAHYSVRLGVMPLPCDLTATVFVEGKWPDQAFIANMIDVGEEPRNLRPARTERLQFATISALPCVALAKAMRALGTDDPFASAEPAFVIYYDLTDGPQNAMRFHLFPMSAAETMTPLGCIVFATIETACAAHSNDPAKPSADWYQGGAGWLVVVVVPA
jgi:hypothetical protein